MKEERHNYEQFRIKRVKEVMMAKKEGFKKDTQIRRLTMDNFKKGQTAKRKEEEVRRIKRVNQALKALTRTRRSTVTVTTSSTMSDKSSHSSEGVGAAEEKAALREQEEFLKKTIKQILL